MSALREELTVKELKEILKKHADDEKVWCEGGEDAWGEWVAFGIGPKTYMGEGE